jgi:cation:H+ antiporter
MIYRPAPVLSHASRRNILPASLGIVLIALAGISILAGEWLVDVSLWWVGAPSILIFLFYLFFARRMFLYENRQNIAVQPPKPDNKYDGISIKTVYTRFAIAALAIIGAGIWLAFIGNEISETYNLSSSFVGSLFLAINTSMPELVVAITAVRIGAIDMAVANILGANMLNMANIFIADVSYNRGPILSSVSSDHLITALGAIVMTLMLIIALRFPGQRKLFRFISWYGAAFIAIYLGVSFFIYLSGSS